MSAELTHEARSDGADDGTIEDIARIEAAGLLGDKPNVCGGVGVHCAGQLFPHLGQRLAAELKRWGVPDLAKIAAKRLARLRGKLDVHPPGIERVGVPDE